MGAGGEGLIASPAVDVVDKDISEVVRHPQDIGETRARDGGKELRVDGVVYLRDERLQLCPDPFIRFVQLIQDDEPVSYYVVILIS